MNRFENFDKVHFGGIGKYQIPKIEPETKYPKGEWISVNYAMKENHPADKNLHFFVDDYQFQRLWNTPDKYINKLKQFNSVLSPDFSTYTDMPLAMQIYNHYRKHWLGAYWQLHGMTVYPTISWSDKDSFEWCFDGEPTNSIVAVSSVGTQKSKETQRLFLQGYEEMMKRLNPTFVIFYGKVPIECDWNVIRVPAHYEEIVKRRKKVLTNTEI